MLAMLEPLVRRVVREELERQRAQWRWRSVKQAAELLDISPVAVHQRITRRQLPSRKLDGRVYVDMEALGERLLRLP
jgi:hypothetical protein